MLAQDSQCSCRKIWLNILKVYKSEIIHDCSFIKNKYWFLFTYDLLTNNGYFLTKNKTYRLSCNDMIPAINVERKRMMTSRERAELKCSYANNKYVLFYRVTQEIDIK